MFAFVAFSALLVAASIYGKISSADFKANQDYLREEAFSLNR